MGHLSTWVVNESKFIIAPLCPYIWSFHSQNKFYIWNVGYELWFLEKSRRIQRIYCSRIMICMRSIRKILVRFIYIIIILRLKSWLHLNNPIRKQPDTRSVDRGRNLCVLCSFLEMGSFHSWVTCMIFLIAWSTI